MAEPVRTSVLDVDTRLVRDADNSLRAAAAAGVEGYWIAGGWRDPLLLVAAAGRTVPDLNLGTAVVSIWPVHPTALAEQALTVNDALGGRFVLGVGLSHRHMVAERFGGDFARSIRYLDEYLSILVALLDDRSVAFRGQLLSASTHLRLGHSPPRPKLVVAASGAQSLSVAGRRADGVMTWMVGPRTLEEHTLPILVEAAARAEREVPELVAIVPLCVADDPSAARARAAGVLAPYGREYPAYRATLDREGAIGPEDLAIVGPEDSVVEQLELYRRIGVAEVVGYVIGGPDERRRTMALLAGWS